MDIEFRQYMVNETCYHQAWNLRNQVLREPLGLSLTQEDREHDKNCWHFGLLLGAQLLATVTIDPPANSDLNAQQVTLRQMVVSPKHHQQGLGQQLIELTEQVLRDKSIKRIVLAARLPAVKFYQKLGYVPHGPVYHHLRIDHRDMVKSLQ